MSFRVYYLAPTVELVCGRRKVEVVWFTCLSVSLLGCLFLSVFHSVCLFVRLLVSFCCCFPNDCNSGSCFSPPLYQHCTAGRGKKISFQCNLCFFFFFLKTYYAIPAATRLNDLLSIAYRDRRTLLSTGDRSLPSFGTAAIV